MQANSRLQLLFLFALCSVLTHTLGQIQPINAAGTGASGSGSSAETTSSSQPLWSYQVKPNSYLNVHSLGGGTQTGHYGASSAPPSLFDAFNGISQRQGALSSSPFLSILPIILIAAGGMLLLLPMLTMMMASPFGGGGAFGGYNNGGAFGYPQQLSKKRSLADQLSNQRGGGGLIEILENVSTTIEELSRKYNGGGSKLQQAAGQKQRNAKSLLGEMDLSPSNHKPAASGNSASPMMLDENTAGGSNGGGGGVGGNSIGNGQASST